MIDFHSHVLPDMDDGSKSVDESRLMLESLMQQGVKKVIATPHFYADEESVEAFLTRRNVAVHSLKKSIPRKLQLVAGAEVKYYSGISRLPELKKLRIEGSKLLLLEMPFAQWSDSEIKELIDISTQSNITLVLAHIERYLSFQKKDVLLHLLAHDILFQANAGFFNHGIASFKAVRMLKKNQIHFIGSDCHNMTSRPPNIDNAVSFIKRTCGESFVKEYTDYGNALFLKNITK